MAFLPERSQLTIGFAHVAYQLADEFRSRGAPFAHFEAKSLEELQARVDEADVLVLSGLWRNELLDRAPKLRFVQSASAGTDQYDRARFTARGVRLASAQGANERAVAEHAMALMLGLSRQIHFARDNQMKAYWRGMLADRSRREQELGGQTLVIVGLGRIGTRLAGLAHAFGMRVVGVKRQPADVPGVERVVPTERLLEVLPQADYVALTCPLTRETKGLIGAAELAAMKPTAALINVARGPVVDEGALAAALQGGRIASAGLDCFHEEPLPASSPFWSMPNVIVTSHTAGETRRYETNVVDILMENLERLYRGEALKNGIV
jgi:phosphoglycerate dehydrogenase-like enzyme